MVAKVVIWGLVLCGYIGANTQQSQLKGCAGNLINQEYEQVLDAYFTHARGTSPSMIVLRVYGVQLEYEMLLDPEKLPDELVRYAATKSIWGNVYSIEKPHLKVEQYVTQAEEVPFSKDELKISDELMQGLLARASTIDTSICEHQPMKGTRGGTFMVKDAQWFEIIKEQGRVRARVTDAGAKVVSQNPGLKRWGSICCKHSAGRRTENNHPPTIISACIQSQATAFRGTIPKTKRHRAFSTGKSTSSTRAGLV